ncbi:ArgJ family protein [Spinellus fusiger]|nr:ArgJ family protein [Spinellus fusiger]
MALLTYRLLYSPLIHARATTRLSFRHKSYTHLSPRKQSLIVTQGTYPHGFKVAGLSCGIKKNGHPDLALILSETPCSGAAVFTTNAFQAAPVLVSRATLHQNPASLRGIVTNSGCANAVTGEQGVVHARQMQAAVDQWTGEPNSVLVMSTGVIGQPLPMDRVEQGIHDACHALDSGPAAWANAAEAFMTTDTFPKLRSQHCALALGRVFRMAGIAKGAGMIHPNMATLLGCIVTDVHVASDLLQQALVYAVDRSFNAMSVDGDMSTNDTIVVLANGASGVRIDEENEAYFVFRDQLTAFAIDLAQLVVRDGEGATKFVTIHVKGADTFESAKKAASHLSTSLLIKTALFGQDANWGRICASLGHSGVPVDPHQVSVRFIPTDGSEPLSLMTQGEPHRMDEARASDILKMEDLFIEVDLHLGASDAKFWTCDLSHDYVTINADYRS